MTEFYKIVKAVGMDVNRTLTLEHLAFPASNFTVRQKWIIFYYWRDCGLFTMMIFDVEILMHLLCISLVNVVYNT